MQDARTAAALIGAAAAPDHPDAASVGPGEAGGGKSNND
jgi:hypothetical protein